MLEAKIASIIPLREELKVMLEGTTHTLLSAQRDGVQNGLKFLTRIEDKARFLLAHLMKQDTWDVTAAQLIEIHTSLEALDVNIPQMMLTIEPGKELQKATHNFDGRQARW